MITVLLSLVISTVLSTLALIVAINFVREKSDYLMSFLVAFLANLSALLPSFIYLPIPYFFFVIGILIWILLVKLFFKVSWLHSVMIGVLGYAINFALGILGVPGLIILIIGL